MYDHAKSSVPTFECLALSFYCCRVVIVAPVETVKTKCIEMNKPFIEGFKYILANEGFGGIYQGAAATAMKQGTNQGFRFMWFNEYKRIVTNDGAEPLSPIGGLLGGMTAGCFSVSSHRDVFGWVPKRFECFQL